MFAHFAPSAVSRIRPDFDLCLDIPVVDRDHWQLIDLLDRLQSPNWLRMLVNLSRQLLTSSLITLHITSTAKKCSCGS